MYRFTIRDMFWLTVVVAVAMGWLVDRYLWTERLDTLKQRYDVLGTRLNSIKAEMNQRPEYPITIKSQ